MKSLAKIVIPILIFSFLFYQLSKDWEAVAIALSSANLVWFIPAILCLLPILLFASFAWHSLVAGFGVKISFWKNFRVWVLSNAVRFLPGSIWQYPGRVYLASKAGASAAVSSACLVIEILLQVLAGAIIIFLVIPLLPFELSVPQYLVFLSIIPFIIFLFLPKVLHLIFPLLLRVYQKIKKGKEIVQSPLLKNPPWKALLATFGTFILPGASLCFLIKAFTNTPFSLLISIGIYAVAWLAGYFVFIVPAGLGISDVTLAALLGLFIPLSVASLIVICFRFLLLANEVLIVALVFFLNRDFFHSFNFKQTLRS